MNVRGMSQAGLGWSNNKFKHILYHEVSLDPSFSHLWLQLPLTCGFETSHTSR